MTLHEKIKFIKDYEKIRMSFVEAINKTGGDGFALWNELPDFTAEELIVHLCPNNIRFDYCPPSPKEAP